VALRFFDAHTPSLLVFPRGQSGFKEQNIQIIAFVGGRIYSIGFLAGGWRMAGFCGGNGWALSG
jgi:hypothetical protein